MNITIDNKTQIFDHLIETNIYWAKHSNFEYSNLENKYIITRYPAAPFNFLYLSKNDGLIQKLVSENIDFLCFIEQGKEEDFRDTIIENRLKIIDNVVANKLYFTDKISHNYNNNIKIAEVSNQKDLEYFDEISSESFMHAKNLAYKFFTEFPKSDEISKLFIAYYNGVPVGISSVSFLNNIAGIYWLGALQEYRNKGIATEMVNYIIDYAEQKGYNSIIAQNLTPSQSLFKKIGFKSMGSLPLYIYSKDNLSNK